jgi:PIN domain nuclease of toxin-antitoxin system
MAAIQNPDHSIFISAVSGMEIAINKRLGKLEAPEGLLLEIP